jgi:hypothetical protein
MSNVAVVEKAQPQQLATVDNTTAMLSVIERAARDPEIDIEKFERLMAMKERLEAKENERQFNEAMSRVQASMRRVSADATNSQTRSNYATYGQLDRALRPLYTAEHLSLSFGTEPAAEGFVGVVCYVSHASGHTREYRACVPADGKGAKGGDVMTKTHAFGSGTSYGMRYLLKMIFNVAIGDDDDDGNTAGGSVDPAWQDAINGAVDETGLRKVKADMVSKWGAPERIPASLVAAYNTRLEAIRGHK